MKINELLTTFLNPVKTETNKAATGANFADTLKEVLTADPKAAGNLQSIPGLAELAGVSQVSDATKPAEALDAVLSRLDTFQSALAQTGVPLKQLAPLVQQLEQDSQQLQTVSQGLPANSPLKKVMDEAAALAYTESYKFNRGDYV